MVHRLHVCLDSDIAGGICSPCTNSGCSSTFSLVLDSSSLFSLGVDGVVCVVAWYEVSGDVERRRRLLAANGASMGARSDSNTRAYLTTQC